MRKIIAVLNMTLDGFCDHTAGIADEELHDHYTNLLQSGGILLYGRITYQLMEYWRPIVETPTDNRSMNDFAVAIDNIKKIVYSRTLERVDWKDTELRSEIDRDEILELKNQRGKDIFVGSPSLIVALTQIGLIDEYQIGVQPILLGSGLPLFKHISSRIDLKLLRTKVFGSGVIILCYETARHTTE